MGHYRQHRSLWAWGISIPVEIASGSSMNWASIPSSRCHPRYTPVSRNPTTTTLRGRLKSGNTLKENRRQIPEQPLKEVMISSTKTWTGCDDGENRARAAKDQFQLTNVTMQYPNTRIVGRKPAGKPPTREYTLHVILNRGNTY